MSLINKTIFIIVTSLTLLVTFLIYLSKHNKMLNVNTNFKRVYDQAELRPIHKIEFKTLDIQKIKIYKNDVFLYDFNKNQIVQADFKGNVIRTFGSYGIQKGYFQAVLNFNIKNDSLFVLDQRNKSLSVWNLKGQLVKFLELNRFGSAAMISGDIILLKVPEVKLQDNIFSYYSTSDSSRIFKYGVLPINHDRGISTDGFIVSNQQNKAFHIAYYTKNIYAFDENGVLYKSETIDKNNHPPKAIVGQGSFSPPPSAVEINREASMNNAYLFVESNIPSRFEDRRLFNRSSVLDVYKIKDRFKYYKSLLIPDYNHKKVNVFDVDENRLAIVQGQFVIIYETKI